MHTVAWPMHVIECVCMLVCVHMPERACSFTPCVSSCFCYTAKTLNGADTPHFFLVVFLAHHLPPPLPPPIPNPWWPLVCLWFLRNCPFNNVMWMELYNSCIWLCAQHNSLEIYAGSVYWIVLSDGVKYYLLINHSPVEGPFNRSFASSSRKDCSPGLIPV